MSYDIRPETPADAESIAAVNRAAFGGECEVEVIARLRAAGLVLLSMVAVDSASGVVAGHILFSRLPVTTAAGDGSTFDAVALGPMAVEPERQRQGIGSALIRAGLRALRAAGERAVIVLGHPEYYRRFGFRAELAKPLRAPFSGEAFMALELVAGALEGVWGGEVRYPAAWGVF